LGKDNAGGDVDRVTATDISRLSAVEVRLAAAVAVGRTNAEIASSLALADSSIESAVAELCRKLGVSSRTELAILLGALGEAFVSAPMGGKGDG
jgi:DNA-binding NarL/FixJ family response regulator